MWWILLVIVLLVLFWWGHTQYALANCMSDAANPASPTHRLASEFGWQKDTLFKLYLARRSMRNNNTTLGMKEIRNVLNLGVKDFMAHGPASPATSPLALQAMAEEQSMLAMAYALDTWDEAKRLGDSLRTRHATAPSINVGGGDDHDDNGDESDDADDPGESLEDLDRRAGRYHKQIDDQIDSTYAFLKDRFGQDDVPGKHSLRTVSVFAVHVATLMAIARHDPRLSWMTLNGFTRSLASRTPDTMPKVKPPPDRFVSYCSIEEALMHRQTDVFQEQGVQPAVKGLLEHLGSNRAGDFELLYAHLESAAEQARKTYLPFLAEE